MSYYGFVVWMPSTISSLVTICGFFSTLFSYVSFLVFVHLKNRMKHPLGFKWQCLNRLYIFLIVTLDISLMLLLFWHQLVKNIYQSACCYYMYQGCHRWVSGIYTVSLRSITLQKTIIVLPSNLSIKPVLRAKYFHRLNIKSQDTYYEVLIWKRYIIKGKMEDTLPVHEHVQLMWIVMKRDNLT